MKADITSDPDLAEATKELDALFPGIEYDFSLQKYIRHLKLKMKIIKKVVFMAFFMLRLLLVFIFCQENTIPAY